jgi:hypothetical protein
MASRAGWQLQQMSARIAVALTRSQTKENHALFETHGGAGKIRVSAMRRYELLLRSTAGSLRVRHP